MRGFHEGRFSLQDEEQRNPAPWFATFLKDVLIPVGSVLIAFVALFSAENKLPQWALPVLVSYLALVSLGVVVGPCASLVRTAWRANKRKRALQSLYPQTLESIRRLSMLLSRDSTDSVAYLLQTICGWGEMGQQPIQSEPEHMHTLGAWLSSIEERCSKYQAHEVVAVGRDFGNLLTQYNRWCQSMQKQLEGLVVNRKLNDSLLRNLKQEWNLRREKLGRLFAEWEIVARRMNEAAGADACLCYFEPLKTLE